MHVPRRIHRAWARIFGWFWLPCPECGRPFGGHEARTRRYGIVSKYMPDGAHLTVCPRCAPLVYQRQIDEITEQLRKKRLT